MPFVVGTVFGLVLACGGDMREDEQLCEEALARAAECCPDLDRGMYDCTYVAPTGGCDGPQTPGHEPAIDEDSARCVIRAKCSDIECPYPSAWRSCQ